MTAKQITRAIAGLRVVRRCFIFFVLAGAGHAGSQETRPSTQPQPSFQRAREHYLKGEYGQAIILYDELGKARGASVRAACGRAEIDLQLGEYDDGIARLGALEKRGRDSAEWHACLGALLAEVGRYEEALRHNRRAAALDEEHLRAHWQVGQVFETLGRGKEAVAAYQAFEDLMVDGTLPQRAEDLTRLGRGFLRYSVLTENPNLVRRTRHVLREVYQEAFHHVDPLYWPARLAAAALLLEKHNLSEAEEDFQQVCRQNPRVPAAHVGLGEIALWRQQLEQAAEHAEAALDVCPNHAGARVLLATTQMARRRFADADTSAREALGVNPNSIEALSVLAAAQLCRGDGAASERTQQRVRRINPKPAVLHHVLGIWLSAGRQFAEAEHHFKQAISCSPTWAQPRTELGLLYMETGEEAAARPVLEAAFALDGFNNRTYHVLQLLDELEKFARFRTEHFVIKYDDGVDGVVAPYLAESLEAMYVELCERFGGRPGAPTIVELFPDHLGFSRRIAGRPFVATIGACTGRVIAMAAPRPETGFGRFNWKTVLRHEFAHVVTLAATENRIPHWMTEGLAVLVEPAPRSWSAKRLLSGAVRRDRLFVLDTIDGGFVRPRRPEDRGQAYAQSEWMIEYVIERFGYGAILRFLEAFREGRTQAEAFQRILKMDTEMFDRDFQTWAARQVEAWGLPAMPVEDPDEIRARLENDMDDPALLARLAEAELIDGELDGAEDAARRALKQDKGQTRALRVLGEVLIIRMLGEKEETQRSALIDEAEPHLRRLHELEPDNPAAIKYLGYVEQSWEQWPEAIRFLSQYQRRFPEDPDPYRRLAAIHGRRHDVDAALRQLEELFRLVENEPAVARQVAGIYRERGRHDLAAEWFGRAIEVDPYDVETHTALAEAFIEMGQYSAAKQEYEAVCKLEPEAATGYAGLRRVHRAMGNLAEASAYGKKAEALGGKPQDDEQER